MAPTAEWQTNKIFVRENAEYVVLLYNAVWAAPRRTFAAVLQRPLDGVGAFRFSWYVSPGAWEQAQSFAKRQPTTNAPLLATFARTASHRRGERSE